MRQWAPACLALIFLVATLRAKADFLFPYDLRLNGVSYRAFVVLPDYFAHHFGVWDDVWKLVRLQQQAPVPEEAVRAVKATVQQWLWSYYRRVGIFKEDPLSDRYDLFRLAERVDDGRSALVVITSAQDSSDIKALLRIASPLFPVDGSGASVDKALMPFQLRSLVVKEFEDWLMAQPLWPQMHYRTESEPLVPFYPSAGRSLGATSLQVAWLSGANAEIKNWAHLPETIRIKVNGKEKRIVQDFVPALYAIARMHKLFRWSGLVEAPLEPLDPQAIAERETRLNVASRIRGRSVSRQELGVRISTLWVECVGERMRDRYRDQFGFSERFHFYDPELGGPVYILSADREKFEEKVVESLQLRPGSAALPGAQLVYTHPLLPAQTGCVQALLQEGLWWEVQGVDGLAYGLQGQPRLFQSP